MHTDIFIHIHVGGLFCCHGGSVLLDADQVQPPVSFFFETLSTSFSKAFHMRTIGLLSCMLTKNSHFLKKKKILKKGNSL